jgi:hypothetical protein
MSDTKVNEEFCHAHLRNYFVAGFFEESAH